MPKTYMSKEGRLFEQFDVKLAIKKHEESAEWEYRDEAIFWNNVAKEMDSQFFNGFLYPDGRKVPAPVIAFSDLGNIRTIAAYDLFPDEYGIIGKITFNTAHYKDVHQDEHMVKEWERGRYSQGETLLHEYVHLWQQIGRGKDPYRFSKHRRETHNKEWHEEARSFGLNTEGPAGVHVKFATPDSPIDILLREIGIEPPYGAYGKPEDVKQNWADWVISKGKEKPRGRSTLHKWVCPDCGLSARIGIKGNPQLTHDVCSEIKGEKVFLVRHDGREHTIYKGK